MSIQSRPYSGLQDLQKMKDLLVEIKRVYPYSSYHVGDMDWWVFYNDVHRDLSNCIRLWEMPDKGIVAWTFWVENDVVFETAVHPDFRGSPEEAEILRQMEAGIADFVRSRSQPLGEPRPIVTTAYADEMGRIALREARGFGGHDYFACLAQDVTGDLPQSHLPQGYHFLDAMHERFADKRADVHLSAFSPGSKMTPDHYRHFMTAPNYDPTLDIVVIAPDARFASFAMGWMDMRNRLGSFEPVGTRADMRRKGLGKAVLLEGLRRLKNRGMNEVLVMTGNEPEQIAFYESAGFHIVNYIRQYTKSVAD